MVEFPEGARHEPEQNRLGTGADDLEQAINVFKRRFAYAAGAIPYYPTVGQVLLPPSWQRPALVVPLDGSYVIQQPVKSKPLKWLSDAFTRNLQEFLRTLDKVKSSLDSCSLPESDIDGVTPYFPNGYFGPMDATVLTGLLATLRPQSYIEIGSGMSTRFARRAIQQNRLPTKIICIDPAPRRSITNIADEVVTDSVLNVDSSVFEALSENDILFLDGSHLCFSGTDCTRFFLEILPSLPIGVYVHIHDIFLPNDYPERIRKFYYNEQQILAAFLFNNREFEVICPVNYLHNLGYCLEGVSFWIKRVGRG